MKFDINLAEKPSSDDLPDQTQNKMFPAFDKICATDIHDMRKPFGRVYDQIVVFNHLELTKFLSSSGFIEDTFINSLTSIGKKRRSYIRDRVIDEFRKHQTIFN